MAASPTADTWVDDFDMDLDALPESPLSGAEGSPSGSPLSHDYLRRAGMVGSAPPRTMELASALVDDAAAPPVGERLPPPRPVAGGGSPVPSRPPAGGDGFQPAPGCAGHVGRPMAADAQDAAPASSDRQGAAEEHEPQPALKCVLCHQFLFPSRVALRRHLGRHHPTQPADAEFLDRCAAAAKLDGVAQRNV